MSKKYKNIHLNHQNWFKAVGESKGQIIKSSFTEIISDVEIESSTSNCTLKKNDKVDSIPLVIENSEPMFIKESKMEIDPPQKAQNILIKEFDHSQDILIKESLKIVKESNPLGISLEFPSLIPLDKESMRTNNVKITQKSPKVSFDFKLEEKTEKESESWTEKYRPKILLEFMGNEQQISEIKQWLKDHFQKKEGTKLGLMIVGPPGCGKKIKVDIIHLGKTVASNLVAKVMGYSIQEFNMNTIVTGKREKNMKKGNPNNEASFLLDGIIPAMARNNNGIPHVVILDQAEDIATAAQYKVLWKLPENNIEKLKHPLHGILQPVRINSMVNKRRKKIVDGKIVIEDIINYEWPAPLILTVNDYQASTIEGIKNATIRQVAKSKVKKEKDANSLLKIVFFNRIPCNLIIKRLHQICDAEDIIIACNELGGLEKIARCSFGDMRRAIIILEGSCLLLRRNEKGKRFFNEKEAIHVCKLYTIAEKSPLLNHKLLDEEESREFIPDMSAKEVLTAVMTEKHDRDYLYQLFDRYNSPFIESMLHLHIPMYLTASHGSVKHPYLPISNENNPSINVMDAMSLISDSWSVSDLYYNEGAWKKNEMYEYYMFHSRLYPSLMAKHPDRTNKFKTSLNWADTIKQTNFNNSQTASRKKMARLKNTFQTDEFGVILLARLFSFITLEWNKVQFVEGVGKWLYPYLYICQDHHSNLEEFLKEENGIDLLQFASNTSIWDVSKSIYRYFILSLKSDDGDISEDAGIDPDDVKFMTMELIDYLQEKTEYKDENLKKTRRKKAVLNLDNNNEELRIRMNIAQDNFAKFLAICRITSDDLDDLVFFSWHGIKENDKIVMKTLKEFCPGIKEHASLNSRLKNIWASLKLHGIHPIKRSSQFDKIIKSQKELERQVVSGSLNTTKDYKESCINKGKYVPTSLIIKTMNSLMFPNK